MNGINNYSSPKMEFGAQNYAQRTNLTQEKPKSNLRNSGNQPAFSGAAVAKTTGALAIGIPKAFCKTNTGNILSIPILLFGTVASAAGLPLLLEPIMGIIAAAFTAAPISGTFVAMTSAASDRLKEGSNDPFLTMKGAIKKGAETFDKLSNKSPNISELPKIIKKLIK